MNIFSYRDVPIDQIVFNKPVRSKDDTYISEAVLKKEDGKTEMVVIQTPGLMNVDGIIRTGNRSHIELAIDKEHSDFYDFISNVDHTAMDVIEKNSESWFGQQFPRQVVEDFYRSILKPGREQTTPCMKLNLPMEGEEILVDFLNKDKKKCFYTEVPKEAKTVVVMQFMGLRFLKQQVLSMWRPMQVFVNDTVQTQDKPIYIQDNLLTDEEPEPELKQQEDIKIESLSNNEAVVEEKINTKQVEVYNEPVIEQSEVVVKKMDDNQNILNEASKEENTGLSIDTTETSMERSENPPSYEDVKNLLERTSPVETNTEGSEDSLLESINLELDEVPMGEEDVTPVPSPTLEQEAVVEDEVPTLTDEMLNNLEVESEGEESVSGSESEEEETSLEEYKEAFQYLENELEKRDEVIKTLRNQMSGMLSVLENVEDEQN